LDRRRRPNARSDNEGLMLRVGCPLSHPTFATKSANCGLTHRSKNRITRSPSARASSVGGIVSRKAAVLKLAPVVAIVSQVLAWGAGNASAFLRLESAENGC
jgi:hypothetical protein